MNKSRCDWVNLNNPAYISYHDNVWGVPDRDDRSLFRKLSLECFQAGLSWETVLNREQGLDKAFYDFDPDKCSKLTDRYLESLLDDNTIIKNRLKVYAVRGNAAAYYILQERYGSFANLVWEHYGAPRTSSYGNIVDNISPSVATSAALSKELKSAGMKFVGPTTVHAFLQAVGVFDDHSPTCFKYRLYRQRSP